MSNYILYGGSFNPIHNGHINVVEEMLASYPDHKVIVMPSFQSPLKEFDYDPGIESRLNILNDVFAGEENIIVDDYEFLQNKKCFTIEALPALFEKYGITKLKLVIGVDQFEQFNKWKDYKRILELVDLLVVSRPGYNFPEVEELSQEILSEVSSYEGDDLILNSGNKISYFELKNNYNISSSKIRSSLRKGRDMSMHLASSSPDYFKENSLYIPIKAKINSFEEFTRDCFKILKEKNALGTLAYDVRGITQPSEFNLIASGTNIRQTSAIAEHLVRTVRKKYSLSPLSVEGIKEGRWVVVDYGSLIVHVFYDFIRSEYNMEELWSEGVLLESEE